MKNINLNKNFPSGILHNIALGITLFMHTEEDFAAVSTGSFCFCGSGKMKHNGDPHLVLGGRTFSLLWDQ